MKNNNNTYQFDIIRGIMCLMIFNRHFFNLFKDFSLIPPKLISIISDSQVALFYFFMLSGLVITLSFKCKDSYPSLPFFSFKRISRLFPVVFIAILLGLIVCETGLLFFKDLIQVQSLSRWALSLYDFDSSPFLALKDIFYALFCGYSYYDANFWTISYELYVPILILIILKWCPVVLTCKRILIIFAISLILLGLQINSLFINSVYFFCFLIGSGIALYGNKITLKNSPIIILGGIVVFCFILPHFIYFRIGNPLRLIGVSLMLCLLSNYEIEIIKRLNKIFIIKKLGEVSFEIYAYHLVVLVSFSSFFVLWLSKWLSYNMAVLITYILSFLLIFILSVISSSLTKRCYYPVIEKVLKKVF